MSPYEDETGLALLITYIGDKNSCVVILVKTVYSTKVDDLIQTGVSQGVYSLTEDRTHDELENFRVFLKNNFKGSDFYNKIWTCRNQSGRLFYTAKPRQFANLTIENLKLKPIIN